MRHLVRLLLVSLVASVGLAAVQVFAAELHSVPSHHIDQPQGEGATLGSEADLPWEASPSGRAYSERNHWLAGLCLLVLGLAEWRGVSRSHPERAAWLLPGCLLASGLFLLIWSDHDAWPIGRLTLRETFSGQDGEMLQHKIFGLLSLLVGLVEVGRLVGRLKSGLWGLVLPGYAVFGSLLLLMHDHGLHPSASAQHIAQHHQQMAVLALLGGLSKALALWPSLGLAGLSIPAGRVSTTGVTGIRGNIPALGGRLWALLVMLIGVLLLVYRE